MKKLALASAVAMALLLMSQQEAAAQYVTYYSPVVAPAPTVVYRPAPVYAAPVYPAPVTYSVARPVVAPVAVTRTRWRPFLGGTVTRTRVGYAPVWGY
ncbi:hypothetical protein Pla123a_20540 [Posidoniimonas polymericola]|uniref:PXPV repeat protein n=1 Tax=Posidoniimonas polymericola TaxID=2528002 RepID=A0A5C5YRD8_9BACT|nr:hypothetical protein [Posidoniimonas polymericola]TWT77393.1 hypothetical protein Pla123a_20540 [Posidoniimonas polymericola]